MTGPDPSVAFLGPAGSFSHQAALQEFSSHSSIEYLPQTTISNCYKTINEAKSTYAVVPLENSTNGQVALSYDVLRNYFFKNQLSGKNISSSAPTFEVIGEQYVTVHHNLLSKARSLESITKVYSHPQVWSQCSNFFENSKLNPSIIKTDTNSTSRAAQLVLQDIANGDETTAAVSSIIASDIYQLTPLMKNIEDDSNNTTRFLVLQNKCINSERIQNNEEFVTLVGIWIVNENSGVLCDVLSVFKDYKLNLTSIASRPSQLVKWQYIFFIEFMGNKEDEDVKKCLESIKQKVVDLEIMGSFPRNKQYYNNVIEVNETI